MKTALLVSGQVRGNWQKNLKNMTEYLKPDAVYTSTWLPSDEDVDFKFPEPTMEYHPVVDTKPYPTFKAHEYRERCTVNPSLRGTTLHRTKQILQHNMLMEQIEPCDVVIRTRHDCVVSSKTQWERYVKKAYEENCALGFGTRQSRWQVWEQVYELPKFMPPEDKGISPHGLTEHNDWGYYLMDTLIIHPYKLWDCDKVSELHNNRELKAAEWGWYQVLSKDDNHYSHYGGCQMERLV